MLETLALKLFTVVNLSYQLNWLNQITSSYGQTNTWRSEENHIFLKIFPYILQLLHAKLEDFYIFSLYDNM